MLGIHYHICTAVSLSQYHGYAGHRSFDKGIKQFGAVPDDTAMFLFRPRHKTRDINKADERDIE